MCHHHHQDQRPLSNVNNRNCNLEASSAYLSVVVRREVGLHPLPEDVPDGLLVRSSLEPASAVVLVVAVVSPPLALVAAGAGTVVRFREILKSGRRGRG